MNCHSKKRQRTTENYGNNKITTNIYDKKCRIEIYDHAEKQINCQIIYAG